MADLNSPVRHRLELLERTIYALQAQHRLLEYRVQSIENENQTLRQNVPLQLQSPGASSDHTLFQPYIHTLTPKPSSGHQSYVSELQALTRESNNRIDGHARALSSLSLLDGPSLLTTPTLTPTRQTFVPKNTPVSNFQIRNSSLASSSTEAWKFESGEGSEPDRFSSAASTLIYCSPKSNTVDPTSETKEPFQRSVSVPPTKNTTQPTVVPWDGTIAWKFINLYSNKKEDQEAMLSSMDEFYIQDEWFPQYGLRYIPKQTDKDAYRTVRIESLPETTTLDGVLAKICYGDVFSADLLNTLPITGYHTARIVFLHQVSAEKFCKWVKKKGLVIEGVRAYATLEKTATYPIGSDMKAAIWNGCSRCLTIDEVPEALLECIEGVIGGTFLQHSVEAYSKNYCTDLDEPTSKLKVRIRFHSIRAALCAFKELQKNIFLRNCVLRYDDDPCNTDPNTGRGSHS